MRAHRLHYDLKPYLPWRFRMALRRIFARRKRQACQDVWPINEAAARPPAGWPGWPEGKQFALVFTHDVEGPAGLAKCRQLMQLEMQMGFRSAFNFIPEGPYRLPRELREELQSNGFEVGIQDLKHDGRLFHGRESFRRGARRINHYLHQWGAVGFRSGFMFHNQDWAHDLDIDYSSCTFDTDPFESQPDGIGTIFPFWVPAAAAGNSKFGVRSSKLDVDSAPSTDCQSRFTNPESRSGYVELPYTLPQDSTLFLLLQERQPDIWLNKLDWIAKHGGMVLLNSHPDYMAMEGKVGACNEFPVEFYQRFLDYVRVKHAGSYWHALPRDIADFVAAARPLHPRRKPKRICMVTHSFYENDGRVTRYAEALAKRGDEVEIFALRRAPDLSRVEMTGGVRLFRIQDRIGRREQTKLAYLFPLIRFFLLSSWWMTLRHLRRRYDLVHVHNVPDFLVFTAWLPKLTGAKLILDIHDMVPEFYASKFGSQASPWTIRALKMVERLSAGFANHVILSNHLWLEKYAARTRSTGKCSVFINNVDHRLFQRRPRTRNDGKLILLFPGGLQWHQGIDIAIRAFSRITDRLPNAEFHIYGEGNMKPQLVAVAKESGLSGRVCFFEPRRIQQIAEVMANADLGVVPKRADSFGNEAYSTKIMEFMSLGVPVVVSSTKIDRFYFNDSVVRFFESGNPDALAEAIVEVLQNDELRRRMIANAREYAEQNSWQRRQGDYLELVDALIENRPVQLGGSQAIAAPDAISCREGRAADTEAESEHLAVN